MSGHIRVPVITRRMGLPALTLLAASAVAALVGCGGASDHRSVPLPGGGVAIGNLVCASSVLPATNMVAQGQTIVVSYTLTDVNHAVPGANLPIAFDVIGGSISNPPTRTDANGNASVTFTASSTYTGPGRVRLIQPDAQLDCDVSFTVFQPACVLRARVIDGTGAIVTPEDACGSTESNVQRNAVRRVVYRVSRPNPTTHVEMPVAGATLHLQGQGLTFTSMDVGPTDANGEFTQTVTPFATGTGTASITADVVRADTNGDGVPDSLPCNTCTVSFGIINPICDANGASPAPVYRDADTSVKAAPLRPGESADVTAFFVLNGMPQAGLPVLVDAANGFLQTPCGPVPPAAGTSQPLHLVTAADGSVCVKYTAPSGFAGTDTVTFQVDSGNETCTQTAMIAVVTCDFTLTFSTPPRSGMDTMVTLTLLNADNDTAMGQLVSLDATGGFFSEMPPYYPLVSDGMGNLKVMAVYHVTPGFTGPAQISASFPGGYPCSTVTKMFTVLP